jgi:hypothetical protein
MRIQFLLILGLTLAMSGCAGNHVAPVSGRVTLNDKPLVNAMVIFQPDSEDKNAGPGSKARTDADGNYALELMVGDQKGAVVGKHTVTITAYEGDETTPSSGSDMKFRKRLVNTKLPFVVPAEGAANADFKLAAPPEG